MPKAIVSTETVHKDLITCEGGWVKLRRMSYGEKLERAQLATDMQIEMVRGSKTQRANVDIMQQQVALFDFAKCIVDHNLYEDDAETVKLDLSTKRGLTQLDPRIGDEIGKYIDELNNFDEESEELGN